MKTIGLLGGMSWESTQTYYRLLNQGVNRALGGLHSADVLLHSLDFAPLEALQHEGGWAGITQVLIRSAQAVERAGADFLVIGSNTMHKVAPDLTPTLHIPLLHIADTTAAALRQQGTALPLFDTTVIHAQAAVEEALQ